MNNLTNITDIDFIVENTSNDIDFNVDDVVVINEGTGCCDYELLDNKPQINFKTLESGNNTYEYLGVEPTIVDITEQDIDTIIFGG